MRRLEGKVAIITGASSGIGEATAKLFAQEGATVVIAARRQERSERVAAEIAAAGGRAVAFQADVSESGQCDALAERTVEAFGMINILVNNAGKGDFSYSAKNVSDEFWAEQIAINQSSVFYMCRAVLRYMEPMGSGAIVNVSSIGGVYHCAGIAYSAAKAAVISITHNLAIQYTNTGIRVNAVCPGGTDTPMFEGDFRAKQDKEFAGILSNIHRTGIPRCKPEEQANAILFFACDESSAVTGQYLVVDNGSCL